MPHETTCFEAGPKIPDFYQILGVDPLSSPSEIRCAYLERASKSHPDKGGSHAEMLQIGQAWHVISDPTRRERFMRADQSNDAAVRDAAVRDATTAAREAANYPATWPGFIRKNFKFKNLFWLPMSDCAQATAIVAGAGVFLAVVVCLIVLVVRRSFMAWSIASTGIVDVRIVLAALVIGGRLGWSLYLLLLRFSDRRASTNKGGRRVKSSNNLHLF
jgi:hypothetical protein